MHYSVARQHHRLVSVTVTDPVLAVVVPVPVVAPVVASAVLVPVLVSDLLPVVLVPVPASVPVHQVFRHGSHRLSVLLHWHLACCHCRCHRPRVHCPQRVVFVAAIAYDTHCDHHSAHESRAPVVGIAANTGIE